MALTPKEINTRSAQAEDAFENKDYDRSVALLKSIIEESPNYAPAYRKLGSIWARTKMPQNALFYLNKAIELDPYDTQNQIALGYYYLHIKAPTNAIRAFEKSLELSGDNAAIIYELFKLYRDLPDSPHALVLMERLQEIEPRHTTYRWEHAKLLLEMGSEEKALDLYTALVKSSIESTHLDILEEWFLLMVKNNRTVEARDWFRQQLLSDPDNPIRMWHYGRSCEADRDSMEALALLEKAHSLAPKDIKIILSLGALYRVLGEMGKSTEYFRKIIEIDPLNTSAMLSRGMLHKYNYGDDAFCELNFAASHLEELPIKKRIDLHYALGKAYDNVAELSAAFEHYKLGGALHSQGKDLKELSHLQQLVAIIKNKFSKDLFTQKNSTGHQTDKPIFILGMPRSGTSLMEQVLSGIEGVYGAGELSYISEAISEITVGDYLFKSNTTHLEPSSSYLERGKYYLSKIDGIAPAGSMRIIDKMPTNFQWTGLIHLILPNAFIIHSRRHPVEICLSAYRLRFALGQYWSDNLRTMGRYYRLYHELMQHWKSVLPENTILDVRYEDMVTDLETQSKRLADHINVPWNNKCLSFHKSDRAVRTASLSQVRQPIYKTSMNRWKKYEPYLQPLLDEIGDLIEEYEGELRG